MSDWKGKAGEWKGKAGDLKGKTGDWKGIVKNGWHPEKEGTTLKSQVKGLVNRGGTSSSSSSPSHTPTPITSLRDPSTFAPPPKHVGYAGNTAAASNALTYSPSASSPSVDAYSTQQEGVQPEAPTEPPRPPKPWQRDTTGLSTAHLPPPPVRRPGTATGDGDGDGEAPPPPYTAVQSKGPPPKLPPRLPPRAPPAAVTTTTTTTTTVAGTTTTSAPTTRPSYLSQATSRLSAAGISVPSLGIGGGNSSCSAAKAAPPPPPPRSPLPAPTPAPTTGTTWAQKQAALKTAADLRRDPSSVSFADARAAAGTANNFRQRHGDQVQAGVSAAGKLQGIAAGAGLKKAPPPPPPAKSRRVVEAVQGGGAGAGEEPPPPPVPLATRPPR
ncbi:hypothetical protein F4780DRAFT_758246 [Xylariomycetidae sp. FL0641]|nr:hypothetical protein F4780DRAFT_758246 [Xylariomycetidae sp. FL0641]